MSSPVSVRLDDTTRDLLEKEAHERNIGLSALLREIFTEAAKEAQRRRIRQQMQKVADHIANPPEAAEFMREWGTPRAKLR
jgi:FKBP-type peptidyl-prolyl cis-trans isomerase (trigger factor)